MGNDKMTRKLVKDRIRMFVKGHPVDYALENHLQDKAHPFADQHGTKKGKRKIFCLEYQWKSPADFVLYASSMLWLKKRQYNLDEWYRKGMFNTASGAHDHYKTLRPGRFWDEFTGRHYRIRNTQTGEIIFC